ncbi:MAG TPA: hypothetical protein VE173_01305 [Longimicrobiales bacterium]|nr:hypothetical protein [Longimicrobiales bacterium]
MGRALFWLACAALLVAAALRLRSRLRRAREGRDPMVDDDVLRRIIEEGVVRTDEDEPLDLDEIREEERRFWEGEEWDEADEW